MVPTVLYHPLTPPTVSCISLHTSVPHTLGSSKWSGVMWLQTYPYLALASVLRLLCVRLCPFVFVEASVCVRFHKNINPISEQQPKPEPLKYRLRPMMVSIGMAPEGWN